jgi:hypothetical protein
VKEGVSVILVIEIHRRYPGVQAIIVTGQADAAKIEQLRREESLSAVISKPWRAGEIVSAARAHRADGLDLARRL